MTSDKMKAILLAPATLPERPPGPGVAEYAQGLGMPIGPLMARVIASDIDFEVLRFFPSPQSESLRVREMTPHDVTPFADMETLDHFAFLAVADANASTDVRPVCVVRRDWPTARVVAPDLARFLLLLAVAGAEAIERDAPDEAYLERREELLADPDSAGAFRAASESLCALLGAPLPARPSEITQAYPDVELAVDEGPGLLTLPRIRELAAQRRTTEAARDLAALVDQWLDLGDLVDPANWVALKQLLADTRLEVPEHHRARLAARGAWPSAR